MTLSGVSWICPTFGRPPHYQHLLEERVESFLRQDYKGPRELLILNDCPDQELVCDAHGVRVVNLNERISTLGEKYNRMVELAQYDLLMPAEDDDLHLSGAISQGVEMLGDCSYWKPSQVIYLPKGSPPIFKHNVGVRHHASIFRREAWKKVGGYPAISGAQDAVFDAALRRTCRIAPEGGLPPEEWSYVYRFGVSPCHVSGNSDHDRFYQDWGRRPVASGVFTLYPHWKNDYLSMTREALANAST